VTTFFTADTHFGHVRIIELCKRPFASVDEMDEALVANWNERVRPGDEVWHLGDFTMRGIDDARRYRARLNGRIHFVWGNHDRAAVRYDPDMWESRQGIGSIGLDGVHIEMCHYAMRVWNRSHHGAIMLYGHSHGNLPGSASSLDVGVDCWDFRPVTLPEIRRRLAATAVKPEGVHA
jgi:calcineurin-like phosphoesterase family protein